MTDTEKAARTLLQARKQGVCLPELPADCRPGNLEEAYVIQDRLFELLGENTAGWFAGCTNPIIQRQLGLAQPYTARHLESSLFRSGAVVSHHGNLPVVIEVEYTFSMRRDIETVAQITESEIIGAVDRVHPSIEVVIAHFEDWTRKDIFSLIADNGTDGALVVADGRRDWQTEDLLDQEIALYVNGRKTRCGHGRDVLDGPLSVLAWMANEAQRAPGILAGQLINTGSCTEMYFASPGDHLLADFGVLGSVEMTLGAPAVTAATRNQ